MTTLHDHLRTYALAHAEGVVRAVAFLRGWGPTRGPTDPPLLAVPRLGGQVLWGERESAPFSDSRVHRLTRPEQVLALVPQLLTTTVSERWLVSVTDGLFPLSRHCLGRGEDDQVGVDVADLLKTVILDHGTGFFLVHARPEDTSSPTREDQRWTRWVLESGRALRLELVDHLVVEGDRWRSCLWERRGRPISGEVAHGTP